MQAGVADRAVSISSAKIDIVDYKADTIFVGPDHGLKTGDKVKYDKGISGNNEIGGLSDDTSYYVIDAGDGRIKLATEEAKTKAIDLTALAEGTTLGEDHSLKRETPLELSLDTVLSLINPPAPIVFDPADTHRIVDLGKTHRGTAAGFPAL